VPQPVATFMPTLVFGADGSVTVGDEIELANEVDVVTNVFDASGQEVFQSSDSQLGHCGGRNPCKHICDCD
jgi:hypothetical protein